VKPIRHFWYINAKGDMVLEPKYSEATSFFNGTALVDRTIVIDKTGKQLFNINDEGKWAKFKEYFLK
jgi:hypothetical protein